jgi:flagellar biosynthetic protein FliP
MTRQTVINRTAILCVILIVFAIPAQAQVFSVDLTSDTSLATRSIQLIALITILSLVPAIAIMVTCFPFMVTVLAILRQAIGLQQSPPNMLIISLALFLTYFVMEPIFAQAWADGMVPLLAEEITIETAFELGMKPLRSFMIARIEQETLSQLVALRSDIPATTAPDDISLSVIIPSFMLSEIERAFQVGFIIFLPFLIIDLVVAAVLMSMGMMMCHQLLSHSPSSWHSSSWRMAGP